MKKIAKILIVLICIGIFLNITLSRYVEESSDISGKLGSKYTGGVISTVNYARISQNFEFYLSLLKAEDYEGAYKVLPYNYTSYKTYEDFCGEVKGINYESATIKSITKKTANLYSLIVKIENSEKEFLMLFNTENTSFSIIPETFLEHKTLEESIKKKKVKYEVVDTINYVDKFVANIQIENLSSKDTIKISGINLVKENGKIIKGNIELPLEVGPNETKSMALEFETDIDFPIQIEFLREFEKKGLVEKYTIDI